MRRLPTASEQGPRRRALRRGNVNDRMIPGPHPCAFIVFRRGVALWLLAVVMTIATYARAESVDVLADRLRNASDFRVRVQAALALGTSSDAAAVSPLCDGLDDSNTAVRSAAAAALGRLGQKSGVACLKARLPNESNASVTSQIRRSIGQLEGGGGRSSASAAKAPDSNSKWYVALGTSKTRGGREAGETDGLVQETARTALMSNSGFAVAPPAETGAQAGAVISKFKLKGYYLQATVEEPKYEGSKLTIVVRVTMYSYPNKALQGEFAPKLTQSGTPSKDKESEDALIKMAVTRAIESFVKVVTVSN